MRSWLACRDAGAKDLALALTRWLAWLTASLLLAACGGHTPITREAYVFGTRVELLVWGAEEARAEAALAEVLREFDRLHRSYHAWQPSELSRLNAAIAAGERSEVSDELAMLIRTAQSWTAASEGLFDVGIGRLVALWGFHGDEFPARLPDAADVERLVAQKPSVAKLRLQGRWVESLDRVTALDFGGYLKGVALDHAAAILKRHGLANALINIGGNILALGRRGDRAWRVGIQHPRRPEPMAILELHDGEAIGTSGDYQRYFELEGRRYCHVIDPRTGRPAHASQSLTVLIPPGEEAGMRSDVLTKPLFIAGDDWPRQARRLGLTHVLRVDAEGRIEATPALLARLQFPSPAPAVRTVDLAAWPIEPNPQSKP